MIRQTPIAELLKGFARQIVAPHPSLPQAQKKEAALLTTVLLAASGMILASLGWRYFATPPLLEARVAVPLVLLTTAVIYVLGRSRHYRAGIYLSVAAAYALALATVWQRPMPGVLHFFVLPVLLASLFFSGRVIAALTAVSASLVLLHGRLLLQQGRIDIILFLLLFNGVILATNNAIKRRSIADLQKSETRYRQMFHDNQAIQLLVHPESGQILDANPAAQNFYGYSQAQLQAMFIQNINQLSAAEVTREMEQAYREERQFFQFRHQLASGEIRDVDVFSSPIDTTNGRILYSVVTDVTARRAADAQKEKLLSHLHFLNRTALELISLPDEASIYAYIGSQLQQTLDEAIIIIGSTTEQAQKMVVRGVYGLNDDVQARLDGMFGGAILDQRYELDSQVTAVLGQGKLYHNYEELAPMPNSHPDAALMAQFKTLLGINHTYLIGFVQSGDLYAGLHIFTPREIDQPEHIEAFVQQASIALQRAQTNSALQVTQTRYTSLFEQSNDGVFILDLQGSHTAVNQRSADMFGYSREELVQLTYRDLAMPTEHTHSQQVLQRLLAGERVPPYEKTFRRKDGRPFPVELNVEVVRDSNGRPLYIQSIVRDITERKQIEDSLRQSEARWRAMLSVIPDLIFRLSADGVYLDYHTPAPELLIFPPEHFLGRKITEVFPPEQAQAQMAVLAEAQRTGQLAAIEFEAVLQGRPSHFEVRFVPSGNEVLAISRDMTALVQARRELEILQERLTFSVETARIAWWEIDAETGKVNFDPRKVTMLGYDPDDFANVTYHAFVDLIHPEDQEHVMTNMRDLLEGRSDLYAVDFRIRTASGKWAWHHDRGQRALSDTGALLVRGFVIDISERKHAADQELLLAMEKERHQMLAQFIQNAAHEFRTPMAIINLNAQLLRRIQDEERQREKIAQIEWQIKRMDRLVGMMLLLTRLESGQAIEEAGVVKLRPLLDTACTNLRAKLTDEQTVCCDYVAQETAVRGDHQLLWEAVSQLIDNAVRFAAPTGTITLRLLAEPPQAKIEIQDDGPGIAPEILPRIFDVFWRQDEAHTTPGFGLGLPIARKIIEMHGGQLVVESQPGAGSTFRILLPMA
ncbi:MAG: PAS domain S-box protein [Anaerolineales bacterium]|nr:PAS domain S-box protein [Anaerolineales bacterium]MCB8983648.1 PAS domain S-box protein [Ardenticatenaceae bacterium]